ncbi:MAG: hypothetical protein KGL67_02525 [Patescibacteria group bacterium]|nr:hypothetical protein [Patescibacteria group bacterium]
MATEGIPKIKENVEHNKPEAGDKVGRRDFIKGAMKAGVGLGLVLGLHGKVESPEILKPTEAELEETKKNFEYWNALLLKEVRNAMDAEQDRLDKDQTKKLEEYYDRIEKLYNEAQDSQLYRGFVEEFVKWRKEKAAEAMNFSMPEYKIGGNIFFTTLQFLQNVKMARKIVDEYDITITDKSENFFLTNLNSFYRGLKMFPNFSIKRSGWKKLNLTELEEGVEAQVNGAEMSGKFDSLFDNRGDVTHELTHALDDNFKNELDDLEGWSRLNEGAKPYVYSSGDEAIKNNFKAAGEIPGYADAYGCYGGISEDKATVSESLISPTLLKNSLKRAVNDPILKRKIEFMSGCRLDKPYIKEREELKEKLEKAKLLSEKSKNKDYLEYIKNYIKEKETLIQKQFIFGTPLTEQDYLDAGFPGICYWPRWSKDENGKFWMDADYFNAILEGKKISFNEENGQTIREIS